MRLPKPNFKKISDFVLLIPIFFAAAVIPIIVRIIFYDPKLSSYAWFSAGTNFMDMFMYHKNEAMVLLDGVLAVLFVILLIRRRLPAAAAYAPLGIYFLLVLISSIFSVVPDQTWNGFYEMKESAFALFGYCMICYYTFAVVRTEQQIKIVMCVVLIGIFLLCAVGVSQFVGHDFYMSKLGKDLIFPQKYSGFKPYLGLAFGVGRVYASLYNPNYVGVYSCLVIPLLMVLTFSLRKKWLVPIYLVLAGMILTCLAGCGSKTAVISIVPCMVFAAVMFGKEHWRTILPVYLVYIVFFVMLNSYSNSSVIENTIDRITADYLESPEYHVTDITLYDDDFTLTYADTPLTVQYLCDENDVWTIRVTEDGNELKTAFTDADDGFKLQDARFEGLEFIFGADAKLNPGFSVSADGHSFFIYYDKMQKTYLYVNYAGKPTKIYSSKTIDSPLFHLMGGLSGRGYIWSKSLPILMNSLILGSGPDTYPFMFPQYDYVSLIQNGWEGILITKPHNMYLQIGIQTGGLSLIALLVFYLWYFFASCKLYWRRTLTTFAERAGAAIFIASACFMIAGLANDSTIGVSVLYWTLIGVGFACNRAVKAAPAASAE